MVELTRCKECSSFPPAPDKCPCEHCLAQYPQGNPVGFKDYFTPKSKGTSGVDYNLEVGICGHPKALLFKCPHGEDVQCLACFITDPQTSCSGLMAQRPDFKQLPALPKEVWSLFERIYEESYRYRGIITLLDIEKKPGEIK